ncbi:T7SS effector LXG polymorphic toxin [Lentibacillus sp. Marseille-P4043]|uniref:T7SS effector LXG polymorphic toxin n=1 Tax=Lentibacillus sp. Marseille-P4043 TaxID=2040293 RepID=UPI000D0B8922|nr:T7SS effector LXG polymorphic toxin [Lentibacillus sp. Marseille-P4043]
MKTLDSASLHEGINATLQEIKHVQSKVTEMQKGVKGIIDLESYLKGRTGESIRSFYEGIHGPFLIYLYQSLTQYRQALEKLQQAVYSYEPDEEGFVREEFLDNDVQHGLDKARQVTEGLVDEANGIMASVADLVSLPTLDTEEFNSMVQKGKEKAKNDVEQLYDLDHEQTKSLNQVGEDQKLLDQYINEMTRTFASDYSITTFDALTALKLPSLPTILKEVYGEPVTKEEVKNDVEQLYDLDHEQTKSLNQVGEDQKLLDQYINEMTRTFASDYSITTFDALTALKLPSLPTILKEVYGEPVTKEEVEASLWTKIKEGTVEFGKGVVNTGKGAAIGVYDVGKDTLVGIGNTVMHPIETVDSMVNMVVNPVDTGKYISNALAESFERDMVNGDAESRSHWVTYALGTAVTTVFGTKGAGTVTKAGVATTKAGAKKATAAANDTVKNMDLSRFLPYAPQYQLAGGAKVPYNVVDGNYLKDQLILKAESLDKGSGGVKFTKELLSTKPKNSPIPGRWEQKGGKVEVDKNGTWVYTNKKGQSVSYPDGYPDFTPYMHPTIKPVEIEVAKPANRPLDYKKANQKVELSKDSDPPVPALNKPPLGYVWHHHQDGRTMMLVEEKIHKQFTHTGGVSTVNKK